MFFRYDFMLTETGWVSVSMCHLLGLCKQPDYPYSLFILWNTWTTDICVGILSLTYFPFISFPFPTPHCLKTGTQQCCLLLLLQGTANKHIWVQGVRPEFSKWNLPTRFVDHDSYCHTQHNQMISWVRVQSVFSFDHFIFLPGEVHNSRALPL